MTSKTTICLWYHGTALGAVRFNAETFPDNMVGNHARKHFGVGQDIFSEFIR